MAYNPAIGDQSITTLKQDTEAFDKFMESGSDEFTDRGGFVRKTLDGKLAQIDAQASTAISNAILQLGYQLAFTFTTGGTLTARNQIVQDDAGNGDWYRWNGSFPKVVAPATNPASDSDWINVSDGILRSELPDKMAIGGNAVFNSTVDFAAGSSQDGVISDATLLALVGSSTKCRTEGFHAGITVGEASYKFLNAADSTAAGYVDGSSRFQIRALDVYACLVVGGELLATQLGLVLGDNSYAATNRAAWNNAVAFAKSQKVTLVASGVIYTDNTLYFEANSDIKFIEPCTIIRTNDSTANEYGNVDILSAKPVDATYKSGFKLYGKVKLEYQTDTSTGDAFNFDNSSLADMSGFYCWIDKCRWAVYGKSVFGIKGAIFQPGNCYTSLRLDPSEAGSAGSACTSLGFTIKSFGAVRTFNIKNVTYSKFDGYCDGQLLSNSKLPSNEVPIGIYTRGGCRSVSFDVAFEQFQGVAIRQEAGQYCKYSFDTQIRAEDVFEQDATRQADIPTTQQAIFSFAGAGTAEFNNCVVDYSAPTLVSAGNTYLFYCGTQANIDLNGGFYSNGDYGFADGTATHLISPKNARFVSQPIASNIINNGNGTWTQFTTATTSGGGQVTFNFPVPFTNASTNELIVSAILLRATGVGNVTYSSISNSSITCITDAGDGFVMRIAVTGKVQS